MNDDTTTARITRDEILDGQQVKYLNFTVVQRKPRTNFAGSYAVLSVDPDTETGFAVSLRTRQLVRFRRTSMVARGGMIGVAIEHAVDMGDQAGTLEFGQKLASRGAVNSRLFDI